MAKKLRKVNEAAQIKPDDFKLIKGVGQGIENCLHAAGIQTYDQLASLTPLEILSKLGKGKGYSIRRIEKDDWIGQAYGLIPKKLPHTLTKKAIIKTTIPQHKETTKAIIRQHYENFTIEFLLDDKNLARRTHLTHIQTGDADTWSGWDVNQLIDFLVRHTRVHIPAKKLEKQDNSLILEQRPRIMLDESTPIIANIPKSLYPISGEGGTSKPGSDITHPTTHPSINTDFAGILCLQDLKFFSIGSDTPIHSLNQNQPYRIRLTLDLTNTDIPSNSRLRCKAIINFKQLGGTCYSIANEGRITKLPEGVFLDIVYSGLPPGLYRVNACVKLFSDETILGLMASLKGDLIQVF